MVRSMTTMREFCRHRRQILIDVGATIEGSGLAYPQYKYEDRPTTTSISSHHSKRLYNQSYSLVSTFLIRITMAQYQVGQKVKYTAIGGGNVENSTTTGEIVEVLTAPEPAGETGVTVKATEDEPRMYRYLILNDNTGKKTAYKADNIVEVIN
ncbi:unnamed protein product [Rhizoctonia solani]|uniref:Hypervirulence associated protein TUDOR domain-containing protein n=1 Tax=Rhizoctonia solani TaxID=456999 RepID=A0A8H3DEK9_9AGAM|nr:unnamed protein product [Rhizoctonia solani]